MQKNPNNYLNAMYLCPCCRLFKVRTFLTVLNHLRFHKNESGFSVDCCVRGCCRSFHIVESLKKHIYRQHRDYLNLSQAISTTNDEWQCNVAVENEDGELVDNFLEQSNIIEKQLAFKRAEGLFILKIREERQLPQVGYTFCVTCTCYLFALLHA